MLKRKNQKAKNMSVTYYKLASKKMTKKNKSVVVLLFFRITGGGGGGGGPPEYIAQRTAVAVSTELHRHGATCREVGTPREDVLLVTRINKTV